MAIFNTSEILKVNVKPKVLWYIQHVFLTNATRPEEPENEIEEGEICTDDDDETAPNRNLNFTEIKPVMCKCKEVTSV